MGILLMFVISSLVLFGLFGNSLVYSLHAFYFLLGLSNSLLKIMLSSMLMEQTDKAQFGRAMAVWLAIKKR